MRAEQLLEKDHPSELMGQRDPPEREPVLHVREIKSERAADHEAQIQPALAARLEELAELDRVGHLPIAVQQRHERALWQAPCYVLVLAELHQRKAGVPAQQLLVVEGVVDVRRAQPPDSDDEDPHCWDTTSR